MIVFHPFIGVPNNLVLLTIYEFINVILACLCRDIGYSQSNLVKDFEDIFSL